LRCGLVAGPAFVIVFSADGATRPGYRPLRHPVSSLSLGPRGWVQVTNFAVTGALYLAAAAGLARAADPATRAAGAGFSQSPRLVNLAGLFQRVSIVTGFGWLTARSEQALRQRLPEGDEVARAIRNSR
jgi:hypothetical protein